ncbi:transposase (plasmid) [Rhizobium sp. CC1099]|uniref:transposase n=1 Tax=Rhizobium sp. CC1099 TaxID=3039160 RepID=UPI0024B0DA47|nr:transposase [Rhizobium sp. CC1099]WFU91371.1 transposase [Rhizobium sp. CC1099]
MIDSTTVRGHWEASRRKSTPAQTLEERPLGFILTAGEASDCKAVPDLLTMPIGKPKLFFADKGYDSDFLCENC